MYGAVSIPNLRLLSNPDDMQLLNRSSIRQQRDHQAEAAAKGLALEPPVGPLTEDERIATLRILAATNSIIMGLLAGVVILQVSDWWLDRQERMEKNAERERQMADILKQEGKKDK